MKRDKLDDAALEAALADLPGWRRSDDGAALERSFAFRDFTEAFAFMTRCALVAEKMDHPSRLVERLSARRRQADHP
jgi:4a-hydroxytetrahydrobiopterin dehydratase